MLGCFTLKVGTISGIMTSNVLFSVVQCYNTGLLFNLSNDFVNRQNFTTQDQNERKCTLRAMHSLEWVALEFILLGCCLVFFSMNFAMFRYRSHMRMYLVEASNC